MIPFLGGTTTKMRVDSLNGVPRPDKPVVSNSQSLIGKPGVIQLSQSIGSFAIPDQLEIENELEKFDLNDLVQYVSTRSGQVMVIEETLEKGFPRVQ